MLINSAQRSGKYQNMWQKDTGIGVKGCVQRAPNSIGIDFNEKASQVLIIVETEAAAERSVVFGSGGASADGANRAGAKSAAR
jgi:hypothetical protein